MANSLSSLNASFWSKEAQKSLFVENNAYMAVANLKLITELPSEGGNAYYRTILSYPASETYTPGTDITGTALSASSESLSVGTFKSTKVTIDDTEKKQSIISIGEEIMKKIMKLHNNQLEQACMAEVTNAQHYLDDGNVGGTAGNYMSLTTDNIPQVFTAAHTKLDIFDAPRAGRVAVIGGHTYGLLTLQQAGRNTGFGDTVNSRGFVGNLFGWDIIVNNNLPYTAVLSMVTNPTDGDTVVIAGVTFTFKTTPTSAGHVLLDASTVDTSRAALAAAINDSGTAGTTYIQLSSENRSLLRDKRVITATNSNSADTLTITGYGDIVVSETLTAAADSWTSKQQHSFFGSRGSVHMVVQIPPHIEVARDPDQFSDIVKSLLGYGKKTYADGAREMVDVRINAATSDWV